MSGEIPTREQLYDLADSMRDEIEDLADERNEWAQLLHHWAADELAAVLTLLCRASGHESPPEGAAIWARADAALVRWAALSEEAEE